MFLFGNNFGLTSKVMSKVLTTQAKKKLGCKDTSVELSMFTVERFDGKLRIHANGDIITTEDEILEVMNRFTKES